MDQSWCSRRCRPNPRFRADVEVRYEHFDWTTPAELKRLAARNEPWRYYLDTEVYLEGVELKGTVRPVDEHGEDHPPMDSLHVVAAVQPGADPASDESAARTAVLTQFLATEEILFIRAVGSSFDGSHREESLAAFGLGDDEAREIGRKFGQVAVFSWRGPQWSLLASAGTRQSHRPWRWTIDGKN